MNITSLKVEAIDNKYVRLIEPFMFTSDVLEANEFDPYVKVPVDFVCDYESVPRIPIIYAMFAHTSKRGGVGHDYLYRFDSEPIVPKWIADLVYLEIMTYRGNPWLRRKAKYRAVKWFGKSSYHKLSVEATYEEIIGGVEHV